MTSSVRARQRHRDHVSASGVVTHDGPKAESGTLLPQRPDLRERTRGEPPAGDAPPVLAAYAVRLGGCRVLLASPQACQDVLRSVQMAVDHAARTGLRAPERILQLVAALHAELAMHDPDRFASEPTKPHLSQVPADFRPAEPVEVDVVARIAGISHQYARRLCRTTFGTARLDGRRWLVDRTEVETWAAVRNDRKAS